MDDKDRELLAEVLKSGGSAAAQGFAQLVRYQFVDGLTTVIVCGLLLYFCGWLMIQLIRWQPEDSDADIPKGFSLCTVSVVIFVVICLMQGGLRDTLAPEGAAVAYVLSKH